MRQHSSLSSQSGVALIAVLLFLILIMIVGAIAVRQSSIDLNVAASDQVGTLLLNNSDSVLAYVETVAAKPDYQNKQYADLMSQEYGVFGYFLVNNTTKTGHQVSFCYRPSEPKLFNRNQRAYTREMGNGFISVKQACDASSSKDYTSDRTSTMTQLIVRGLKDEFSDDFNQAQTGTSLSIKSGVVTPKVQINSISVLPAMSNKSATDIKDCLGRPVGNAKDDYKVESGGNVNDCLRDKNIPSTFVVEEGFLKNEEQGGFNGTEIASTCESTPGCNAALTNPQ